MSWYCDRCGCEKKDSILGGLISTGDYKYNSKNTSCMKEHGISSFDDICSDCYSYLFESHYGGITLFRLNEDKKYCLGDDNEGLSSRFNNECFVFDKKYDLIDSRTKLYWNEDYDEIIEGASADYRDTEYLYNNDYAPDDEECARCGQKIKTGDYVYTYRLNGYLDEHRVYDDICSNCNAYLQNYIDRDDVDSDFQANESDGMSSRLNPKCKDFDTTHSFVNPRNMKFYDEDGFEDISFSKNANIILQKELFSKSTCAAYKSLVEAVNNSYQTRFASDFQTYVTRLGLIINKIVENKNFYGKNHYPELLNYICKDILDNDYLYKKLRKINLQANNVKHSTNDITVDIKDYLIYYNSMIDKLKELSGCKSFEKCHIYHKKTNLNNQLKRNLQKEIICHCCGRVNPNEFYRCPKCKKLTCDKCYSRKERMCEDCEKNNKT